VPNCGPAIPLIIVAIAPVILSVDAVVDGELLNDVVQEKNAILAPLTKFSLEVDCTFKTPHSGAPHPAVCTQHGLPKPYRSNRFGNL
jgi:hypothetical protein